MRDQAAYDAVRQKLIGHIKKGGEQTDAVAMLKAEGAFVLDAIKLVRELYGVPLASAKQIVASHPSWSQEKKQFDSWYDAGMEIADQNEAGN